ncbi:MAG TPA: hypothetical protein VLZ12_03665 [Verrucomicrobiae bacterium]|nr:hypothetical protein [Verrucomicrobiae bacterium]
MSQRSLMYGVLLAIAASGAILYKFYTKPSDSDLSTKSLFQAYTQVTAQEISRLLGGRGDVVVLMWGPPSDDASHPGGPPDVQAVCQALQRAGLKVVAKHPVPPVKTGYDIVWTAEDYRAVLEQYTRVAALVSFVGTPRLSDSDIQGLPSARPKLIVVRLAKPETTRPLLEQGVVDAAILPQVEPPFADRPPKTTREWFDKYYLFVTPATVAKLSGN